MITLYASLHFILGAAYLGVLGFWTAYDVYKGWKKGAGISALGAGLSLVGFTCGPHHIEMGLHILSEQLYSPIGLAFVAVAIPFPLVFASGRFAALLGLPGDFIARNANAKRLHYSLLSFWMILSFCTGAAWYALIVEYGWPTFVAGPQYILAVLYSAIGGIFYRNDNANAIRYRKSSLNNIMLAGLFITCASSHWITATIIGAGLLPFEHVYLIDSLAVVAAILFLLLIVERKWVLLEDFTIKR